jgi:stage V sporulation protein SpoVS
MSAETPVNPIYLSSFRPKKAEPKPTPIPVNAYEVAAMTKTEYVKALAVATEALTAELVNLATTPARLKIILENTPHSDIRHAIAQKLGIHLIVDGQDHTFSTPTKRTAALKKHLQNLCMLFPNRTQLLRNPELTQCLFEQVFVYQVSHEVRLQGVQGAGATLKWLMNQTRRSGKEGELGQKSFPTLDNYELAPVYVRAMMDESLDKKGRDLVVPNVAIVKEQGECLIAWGLSEAIQQGGGKLNTPEWKWYFVGNWLGWGFQKSNGYWSNPRGYFYFKGQKLDPIVTLFGHYWINFCNPLDKLDLNPRHWKARAEMEG